MRDKMTPAVKLGNELQLYLVELAKADRLAAASGKAGWPTDGLPAWIKYFQHWKEPSIMNQIAYPPVRRAMRKLKALSSDEETRRLAEVRERALMTERTEISAAEKRGEARGANAANARAIKSLIQKGLAKTEAEAQTLLGLTHLAGT